MHFEREIRAKLAPSFTELSLSVNSPLFSKITREPDHVYLPRLKKVDQMLQALIQTKAPEPFQGAFL
ncbi:hypothetical protein OJAV_G00077320 [Oryzias javanicus]|uniref:Uncharacterized protein n=1 Tax=Oryzias javanicus TaxID=123683 RepID=A0A3S2UET2_ORYJA|nr:hypothetical protein OJAV_G00077320 [Oryzias javanicus]